MCISHSLYQSPKHWRLVTGRPCSASSSSIHAGCTTRNLPFPHSPLPSTLQSLHEILICHLVVLIAEMVLSPSDLLLNEILVEFGFIFENQPSSVLNCSWVTTVPPLLPSKRLSVFLWYILNCGFSRQSPKNIYIC